jgi:hypothetical protein
MNPCVKCGIIPSKGLAAHPHKPKKLRCECCLNSFPKKKLTKVDEHALICEECMESESDYETCR